MPNAWFRTGRGFGAIAAPALGLFATTPAKAAALTYVSGAAPIAIAAGAVGFALASTILLIRANQRDKRAATSAHQQMTQLRADLDQAQAILEGMPEVTIRWGDVSQPPVVFGAASTVLPAEIDRSALLVFERWIEAADAEVLDHGISRLRTAGEGFDISILARDGRRIRAAGRAIGGASILRLRPAFAESGRFVRDVPVPAECGDCASASRFFARLGLPVLVWPHAEPDPLANKAAEVLAQQIETTRFFSGADRNTHRRMLDGAGGDTVLREVKIGSQSFDIALHGLSDGYLACLVPHRDLSKPATTVAEIGAVIDALERPVALFDARRQLVRANRAYADFWELEPDYMKPGTSEQAMLDRIRTKGLLPAEVDYRAWRAEHLKSYGLTAPRETLWHRPDGRAVSVSSVPMSAGGVIYVFNDLTERLALETRYNALNRVQSETLNALSEGVAVFGTNGRLTLANPQLSMLWKLPSNVAFKGPHIDDIAAACDQEMPEDGAIIWTDLKQVVIDLNPARGDRSGRIRRADGRLIDWAAVRLPDGKTLLTFTDVTESANYQQVLKERNDALVTADRLKDAFVQNVSYELRSPLTSIIGFAEVLATGGLGELNERQKAYAEFIRVSSATLGVLIDNILDLATVDAGIAQLDLQPQDIPALVDRARAGLAGTLAVGADSAPLNLSVEIDEVLPEFVADGTRIVQVLYNLLSSAARFSHKGSEIHLKVTSRGNDRVLFIVEDEGIVFPEEFKASLGQRFSSPGGERRQRGSGLGLTIVRTFVHLHGGSLRIEERKPNGTRIIVNLPARGDLIATGTSAAE